MPHVADGQEEMAASCAKGGAGWTPAGISLWKRCAGLEGGLECPSLGVSPLTGDKVGMRHSLVSVALGFSVLSGVSPAQTPLAELQHPGIDSGTTRGARQSTVSSGSGLKG